MLIFGPKLELFFGARINDLFTVYRDYFYGEFLGVLTFCWISRVILTRFLQVSAHGQKISEFVAV